MRKFSWMLLVLLGACQDQPEFPKWNIQEPSDVEQKSEPVAAQLSEEEVVVGSAKELKTVSAKKIIWKKDGAEMVLIPEAFEVIPAETVPAVYDGFGDMVKAEAIIPEKKIRLVMLSLWIRQK